jgi:hypothetical protein
MRRAIGSAVVGLLGVTALSGVCFGQALSGAPLATQNWPLLPAPAVSPPPDRNGSLDLLQPPPPPSPPTRKWVHLNGAADLEHLRATNFNHYVRAQPILAAANELCQPGPPHSYPTRFNGNHVSCESMFWLTSNPPKKVLEFHLDDVGYIAVVSVTVSGGKMVKGPLMGAPVERNR